MERRTKKMLIRLFELLLWVVFAILLMVSVVGFACADTEFEAIKSGVAMIVCLIILWRE